MLDSSLVLTKGLILAERFAVAPSVACPSPGAEARCGVMGRQAEAAASLMKALSHEGRLMTLCHLSGGEKSVTELEDLLGARQAAVSQQLARLRQDGLVTTRRDGKAVYYSIADPRAARLVEVVYDLFCRPT